MQFLEGAKLSAAMHRLATSGAELKVAIAYWGDDALTLLGLDPSRTDVEIVCCLSGGKSSPTVIRHFGDRATQNDRLHAKVVWSPMGAIVGSANASSNGLPQEETASVNLIEAGIYVEDGPTLKSIRKWFDALPRRKISEGDLRAAASARRRTPIPDLVTFPETDLDEAKMVVLLWAVEASYELDAKVSGHPEMPLTHANWYYDNRRNARRYPFGAHALVYRVIRGRRPRLAKEKPYLQSIPEQRLTAKVDGLTIVWAVDVPTWKVPGLPRFRLGPSTDVAIRQRVAERGCRLNHHLATSDPNDGFISWEPLTTLLGSKS